mgnify:CR=1 FL=1
MIDLTAARNEKLTRLANAGAAGLPLADIGVGTAIHLQLHGFAKISDSPQRVTITSEGRAFRMRDAYA